RLREAPVGVREPVELVVVVGRDPLVEAREGGGERLGVLDGVEGEGGDALEGDLGDEAERPEPDDGARHRRARALPGPDDGAVAADQLEPDDLRREPAEPGARAVRTRGDGAGDGLDVDVSEVLQTEAARGELDAEVAQP